MKISKESALELTSGFTDEKKGCVIFDFGCYFPYSNQQDLCFEFSLGMEKISDIKLNHRYPNKDYVTISRKNGRKISKLGYPYFTKLGEFLAILSVTVGVNNNKGTMLFPIKTLLTEEKSICLLQMHLQLTEEFSQRLWNWLRSL